MSESLYTIQNSAIRAWHRFRLHGTVSVYFRFRNDSGIAYPRNSWAVVIDRTILDVLNSDRDSQIEMTTDGKSIQIMPLEADKGKAKVREARAKVNAKHAKAFKKLAK